MTESLELITFPNLTIENSVLCFFDVLFLATHTPKIELKYLSIDIKQM